MADTMMVYFGLNAPAELKSALRLKNVQYFVTKRPWLDLYGINVRPIAPVGSASRKPYVDLALIHHILPDELVFEVFVRMTPYNLGRTSCLTGLVKNYKLLKLKYEGSWRKMWLSRPRVRTDGFYVSRNTYIHVGVAEWKVTNPVHLIMTKFMPPPPAPTFLAFHPQDNNIISIGMEDSTIQIYNDLMSCLFSCSKCACIFKISSCKFMLGEQQLLLRIPKLSGIESVVLGSHSEDIRGSKNEGMRFNHDNIQIPIHKIREEESLLVSKSRKLQLHQWRSSPSK
ncbi:hypothetical protein UlMin_028387 [Ulmus minor]